jgi:hypothetical protein
VQQIGAHEVSCQAKPSSDRSFGLVVVIFFLIVSFWPLIDPLGPLGVARCSWCSYGPGSSTRSLWPSCST